MSDGPNEKAYLEHAYAALASQFPDRKAFETFYVALPDDATKDQFLRVASFYRFLVKEVEWHADIEGSGKVRLVDLLAPFRRRLKDFLPILQNASTWREMPSTGRGYQ